MWYEWDDLESFNLWHDALCLSLGYPLHSVNQQTGEIDLSAQPTTSYTKVYEVENKWIAEVEDDYSEGLVNTDLRVPMPEIDV
jgi:hypothetical protein